MKERLGIFCNFSRTILIDALVHLWWGLLVDPLVHLWWGLPPNITLAVALALARALKVSESHLIGPGGQPLSLWSCLINP